MQRLLGIISIVTLAVLTGLNSGCERRRDITSNTTDTVTTHDTTHDTTVVHDTTPGDTIVVGDTTIIHDTTVVTVIDTVTIINGPDTVYVIVPDSIILTDTLLATNPGYAALTFVNASTPTTHPWVFQFAASTGPNGSLFTSGKLFPGDSVTANSPLTNFIALNLWAHRLASPKRAKLYLLPGSYRAKLENGSLTVVAQ